MPLDPHDFTPKQATDLARYFIGPKITAHILISGNRVLTLNNEQARAYGTTWREAFERAGVSLPPYRGESSIFAAHESRVMLGAKHVCTAVSNTFAKRIARALNLHKPDAKGV